MSLVNFDSATIKPFNYQSFNVSPSRDKKYTTTHAPTHPING